MNGAPRVVRVLVIGNQRENFFELLAHDHVAVDQAPWADVAGIVSYSDSLVVHLRPQRDPFPGTPQASSRSFSPDVVLLRSFVLGQPGHDWRHLCDAFFH